MVEAKDISASEGEDAEQLAKDVTPLVEGGGKWELLENRRGLRTEFRFKSFKTTWVRTSHCYISKPCSRPTFHLMSLLPQP